jgi:AhpD family alkylhydroperoxidase
MERRMSYAKAAPDAYKALDAFSDVCEASGLDPLMLVLVQMRASQINGCAFCLDMHSKDARAMGESEHRLHGLLAWREVDYYSDKERAALLWTEAITLISQDRVPDAIYEEVRKEFGEEELAKLTMSVIAINAWNRLCIAFRTPAGNYQSTRQPVIQMAGA